MEYSGRGGSAKVASIAKECFPGRFFPSSLLSILISTSNSREAFLDPMASGSYLVNEGETGPADGTTSRTLIAPPPSTALLGDLFRHYRALHAVSLNPCRTSKALVIFRHRL